MTQEQVIQIKPLVQAYIGDCVYEQYVRSYLISKPYKSVHDLHKKATAFVKASAQAEILLHLQDELTAKESDIVRRGRNAHPHTVPKNADIGHYHLATGFEALIGYLHLTENFERLEYILQKSVEIGETLYGITRS
jgi:ribonuclease-3 family protein